jgi:hypothetical protein
MTYSRILGFGLACFAAAGCATTDGDGAYVRGPVRTGGGAVYYSYLVDGQNLIAPDTQLTRYPDAIRGTLHGARVEIAAYREGERIRVEGMIGGQVVALAIDPRTAEGAPRGDGVIIHGGVRGPVSLRWTAAELTGRAGCFRYDLESTDGKVYETPRRSGLNGVATGFEVPDELASQWGEDDARAVVALLLTGGCDSTLFRGTPIDVDQRIATVMIRPTAIPKARSARRDAVRARPAALTGVQPAPRPAPRPNVPPPASPRPARTLPVGAR